MKFIDASNFEVIPDVDVHPSGRVLMGWRPPRANDYVPPIYLISDEDRAEMGETAEEWLAVEIAFQVR